MASFVPYYRKKQLQFKEVEGELMALLQKDANDVTTLTAVEKVRAAQIRALREKMAKLEASEKSMPQRKLLQNEIDRLQALPAAEILQTYKQKVAHIKAPLTIPRAPQRGHW